MNSIKRDRHMGRRKTKLGVVENPTRFTDLLADKWFDWVR
jgi:hypothetical protein